MNIRYKRLRSLPLPWNNKRPSSKHELSQRSGPVLLDASGWQLEQALDGLPPEALHPLGVQQLPHPVLREPNHGGRKHSAQRTEPSNPSAGLRKSTGGNGEDLEEVDDVGLEQRAVAAEEGGEGLHPLAGPRRRLARVRTAAAARRSRRHRAGRREELSPNSKVRSGPVSESGYFLLGCVGPEKDYYVSRA